MSGAGGVKRNSPIEDRRMWRLLLAQLHPDAGGDQELFLFASALRERLRDELTERAVPHVGKRDERDAEPFLQAWHGAMSAWASHNHDSLKGLLLGETTAVAARE